MKNLRTVYCYCTLHFYYIKKIRPPGLFVKEKSSQSTRACQGRRDRKGGCCLQHVAVGHLVRSVQIPNTLAKFFNHEIKWLADRFLMEIEENVNPGTEKRQF